MTVYMPAAPFPVVTSSERLGPWMQHIALKVLEDLASPGEAKYGLAVNLCAIENGGRF